jgi:glycosyltransferase involved in cell wall biosynthesis
MEALAAGVPLLGSDCIGLREVLAGTPARTAPARDAAAWAGALAAASAQPWTEAARAYAAEARRRFDAARAAEELQRLFSSLVYSAAV